MSSLVWLSCWNKCHCWFGFYLLWQMLPLSWFSSYSSKCRRWFGFLPVEKNVVGDKFSDIGRIEDVPTLPDPPSYLKIKKYLMRKQGRYFYAIKLKYNFVLSDSMCSWSYLTAKKAFHKIKNSTFPWAFTKRQWNIHYVFFNTVI